MIKKIVGKTDLFQWLALAFEISFMLCMFAPIDIFFANKDEYWFSFGQLMSVSAIVFVLAFLILSVCFFGISKLGISNYVYAALVCGLVYLYIQGNYIPRNYGVLNGTDIDWNSYVSYGIASIAVIAICIILCIILCVKFKEKVPVFGKGVSVFLFLIQLVTTGTLVVQNIGGMQNTFQAVNTDKNLFELSSDRNIVVFILDTYDGEYFSELLDSDNEKYSEMFADFTFYKDTLGAYPTTKCAIPYMLTGKWYENEEPYVDYIKKSYIDNPVYEKFNEKNFTLNVYTNSMYLSPEKIEYENIEVGHYIISDKSEFAKEIYKLVSFNYMPHQLKQYFFTDTDTISKLKTSDTSGAAFSPDVQKFAERFEKEGLSLSKTGNLFKFYHLEGTHSPYTFGEDLKSDSDVQYTPYDEAAGNALLVKKYIDSLKSNGVYDDSTIVILADHGQVGYSQNPIFMIKNAGEHHEFQVSDTSMSFEFLDDIWIALANGEIVDDNFISNCSLEYGSRRFLFYNWDDAWSRQFMPGMEEMFCKGTAYDTANLEPSGRMYLSENADYSYALGTVLEFTDGRTGYTYCPYGISYGNVNQKALLKFDLSGQKFENIKVTVHTADKCGDGAVSLYANDQLTAELSYGAAEDISFIIPKASISDDNILELVFDQTGSEDSEISLLKKTNLKIDTVVLENSSEEFDLKKQRTAFSFDLGKTVSHNEFPRFIQKGFSTVEESLIWTNGNEAELKVNINEDFHNIKWDINCKSYNGEQPVQVYVNESLIARFTAKGKDNYSIIIPGELITDGELVIKLLLPNAVAPCDVDPNFGDKRMLALAFYEMTFSDTDEEMSVDAASGSAYYDLGTELYFDKERNTVSKYCISGFSDSETNGTWTDKTESEMKFMIKNFDNTDLELTLNYKTFNEFQNVTIYANGKKVESYIAEDDQTKTVLIPADCIKDGVLDLIFELPDAISPKELGKSDDGRTLALYFKTITISEK
ncbi:MAG: hypothetical protein ACI4J0_11900 [Huintestinicola sp.]|uniref:hypothetical protein n=1 Tax=Huintestinicola sp. TaxID=2981661 RepID=UPI003F0F5069